MVQQALGVVPRTVLIVDSDMLSGRALAREFKARGYETTVVQTFPEAVARVAAAVPDLVVLDCYLNSRAALEVLRAWKVSAPKLNVILVSANASLSIAVEAMREGALGFCAKPVTAESILGELDHRTSSATSPLPVFAANHRLCSESLYPEGVDRFFALSRGLLCIAGFDGYFKLLNRAWEGTLGYTLDELCAVPYLELIHPADREKASNEAVQISNGEAIFNYRNRYRCKSGGYKWLAWNASPSPAHGLIYASASDITAAVGIEQKLASTAVRLLGDAVTREGLLEESVAENDSLVQLDRFKDEMAGLLVHDLKSPLSVITANYDFILETMEGPAECKEALVDSQNATRRVLRLLANLLDLARLEDHRLPVNRVVTDVSKLFEDLVTQRRVLADGRRITIESLVPPALTIEVDADLLLRTVENILDNAVRYTSAGGRIELRVREDGEGVEVRIGNTGAAIPVHLRSIIFDKHQQGSAHVPQMTLGLGLYFCRLATEAQGGTIWVEETDALPTVFAIRLPRDAQAKRAGT